MSALRGAWTRRRKRWRPRTTASGASAGPSTMICSVRGRRGARRGVALGRGAVGPETTMAARRPKGGSRPRGAPRSRSRRRPRGRPRRWRGSPGAPARRSGPAPGSAPPARPARPVTWERSWKVRSAARMSPKARPRSPSTTPTSVRTGKLWPLATSWVPMTMSTSPFAIASSSSAQPLHAADACRSTSRWCARSGKRAATSSASRSTPGPHGDQAVPVAAVRAGVRPPLAWPQWWQRSIAAEAVLDQPGRAVRALEAVAAGAAERERRIAAPVEEEERLLAARRASRRPRRRAAATGSGRAPAGARRMSIAAISGSAASAKRSGRTRRA